MSITWENFASKLFRLLRREHLLHGDILSEFHYRPICAMVTTAKITNCNKIQKYGEYLQ